MSGSGPAAGDGGAREARAARGGRSRRPPRRRPRWGRVAAAAAVVVLVILAPIVLIPLLTHDSPGDPFSGTWVEPSSDRRVEIEKDGGIYWLYYGAAQRPYQATRVGDQLRVRVPMGGQITVETAGDDRLDLYTGDRVTRLERVPAPK